MTVKEITAFQALNFLPSYLKDRGWNARPVKGQRTLEVMTKSRFCRIQYYFHVDVELSQFLFYIVPELRLQGLMLNSASEYICRANMELNVGNFELDFYDVGQVSFKSSLGFRGEKLSPALMDGAIDSALTAFDKFFPVGLMRAALELSTPAEAIGNIQSTQVTTIKSAGAVAAFELLTAYVKQRGWNAKLDDEKYAYCVLIEDELIPIRYILGVEHEQIYFTIVPRIKALKSRQFAVAQYVCRANCGMRIGHFDFDFRSG